MERGVLKWPNWVGVVVEDLEAQRRFYGEVLGLRELEVGEDWAQFDMGFPNLFELIQRSKQPQYDRTRYQTGFAVDDIRAARDRLVGQGVEAITQIEGGPDSGGYWCYFRDSERNVFEISQRIGESWVT